MSLVRADESVLVIVDAQRRFVAHPAMRSDARDAASRTVEHIAWLAHLAAALGVPAVVAEEGAERNGSTDERIVAHLAPGTPVTSRTTFAITTDGAAMSHVRQTQRTTVVLAGFETDVCVAQSGVVMCGAGLRVVVPEDATYSSTEIEHRRGLSRLRSAGAEITSTKGLTFEWIEEVPLASKLLPQAIDAVGTLPWRT